MPTSPSDAPDPGASPERTATVWSSTHIPSKSPYADFGTEGYSVAWVDTADGRVQVLVDGQRPSPGTVGRLITRTLDDDVVDLFSAGGR